MKLFAFYYIHDSFWNLLFATNYSGPFTQPFVLFCRLPPGQPSTSNNVPPIIPSTPQYPHHQDYLNRLHASALADQQAATLRASLNRSGSNGRKRALSASPGYSELDLANLMRHSPTSLQLLNAAAAQANNGSPSSSGSYGRLSGKNHEKLWISRAHCGLGNLVNIKMQKRVLKKKLIEFFRCEQSSVARSPSSFVSPSAIASAFATHFTLLVTPKFIYTFLLAKSPSSPPNFRASPR